MGDKLRNFLEAMGNGLVDSPYCDTFSEIERVMDEALAAKIQQVTSELSGTIVQKLADELEARRSTCGGHKVVQGFAFKDEEGV